MLQEMQKEVRALREDLETAANVAKPTYQVKASMVLAVVHLLVLIELIKDSQYPEERRRFFNEFQREKKAIEKGIQRLFESARSRKTAPPPCRTVP